MHATDSITPNVFASMVTLERYSVSPDRRKHSVRAEYPRPLPPSASPIPFPQPVQNDPRVQSPNTSAPSATLDEIDRALSLASHELKSPLSTILASLQLIETKVERMACLPPNTPELGKTVARIQELLALAERQVELEDRLATDLVDACRTRSAQLTLAPQLCDLGQLVADTVAAQRVAFPRRIIYLALPDQCAPVYADPTRIVQVVTNYLTNALKYSPSDRPVTVQVRVRSARVRVSVRDLGPGLASAELKRVWERFYRVRGVDAHAAIGAGLGLGLYIAREIVQLHGGRVGVTSKPAYGATFWFTLPLVRAA
jgi:signal transduction histidine kinase